MSTVSVIIVHYKAPLELINLLATIDKKYEIIVVDNDHDDIGFGAGVNAGVRQATGDFIFVIGPDSLILDNAIDEMAKWLNDRPEIGMVGPVLLDEHKKRYPYIGTKILTPMRAIRNLSFLHKYLSDDYYCTSSGEVDIVPGSAFMMRKSLFQEIGGFDEKFFLYFEESDLGKRICEAGYKNYILDSAKVVHFWGKKTTADKPIDQIFIDSRRYYFCKHFGLVWNFIIELFCNPYGFYR